MKVYIGPYVKWWGPYQLAELIPFISEDTQDKIGEFLAKTWVNDLCEWFYPKQDRNIKVRIDKYDTWNMDHTLAVIIVPMLKQLKATKHGSNFVDDEDLPEHMRHGDPEGYDNWVHYKWEWVLNEMIWAFEQELDDSWEDKFVHKSKTNSDYWVDRDGIREYNDRMNNGFRLFGKYYRGLWD